MSTCRGAYGREGGIEVTFSSTSRSGSGSAPAPGATTWRTQEQSVVPACTGNTATTGEALCGGATWTCPSGQMRFWVWQREVQVSRSATGATTTTAVSDWRQRPGTLCLGPDAPGVPATAGIAALVEREFARLPLPVARVRADPAPQTLVAFPTAFSAGSPAPVTFSLVLLGLPVAVTAQPVSWTWSWGDGTTATTTGPGVPHEPVVSHTYARPGDVAVSVSVSWRGTFRIGSQATTYPVQGSALTTSPATVVAVREARAELIGG